MIYHDTIEVALDRNERYISNQKNGFSESFRHGSENNWRADRSSGIVYLIRLRVLSRLQSEEEFINPSLSSLKNVIIKISAKSGVRLRTVEDHKQVIRNYYKWKLSPSESAEKAGWIHIGET